MEPNTIEDLKSYLEKTGTDIYITVCGELINGLRINNKYFIKFLDEHYFESDTLEDGYVNILEDGTVTVKIQLTYFR